MKDHFCLLFWGHTRLCLGNYVIPRIQPRSAICKPNMLLTVLSLCPTKRLTKLIGKSQERQRYRSCQGIGVGVQRLRASQANKLGSWFEVFLAGGSGDTAQLRPGGPRDSWSTGQHNPRTMQCWGQLPQPCCVQGPQELLHQTIIGGPCGTSDHTKLRCMLTIGLSTGHIQ